MSFQVPPHPPSLSNPTFHHVPGGPLVASRDLSAASLSCTPPARTSEASAGQEEELARMRGSQGGGGGTLQVTPSKQYKERSAANFREAQPPGPSLSRATALTRPPPSARTPRMVHVSSGPLPTPC